MWVPTRITTIIHQTYPVIVLDLCQGCTEVDLLVSDLSLRPTDLGQVTDLRGLKVREEEVYLRPGQDLHSVPAGHQEDILEVGIPHHVEVDLPGLCRVLQKVQVRPAVLQFSLHQRWLFIPHLHHHHSPLNLRLHPTMN